MNALSQTIVDDQIGLGQNNSDDYILDATNPMKDEHALLDYMDKEFVTKKPQKMGSADDLKDMSPFPYILMNSAGESMTK